MNIIKELGNYIVADVRDERNVVKYELREFTIDHPEGRTCGEYFTKKSAMKALKDVQDA